jgi:hypothetical protein
VLGTYDAAAGVVTASLIVAGLAPVRSEGKLAYVDGFVLGQSAATRFQVGDVAVDTTDVATPLAVGMRVRLRGRCRPACCASTRSPWSRPMRGSNTCSKDRLSAYASIADFRVRGERVDASSAVVVGGPPPRLPNGVSVRVKGVAVPGRVTATEVTILR